MEGAKFTADDVMLYLVDEQTKMEGALEHLRKQQRDTPAYVRELAMFRSVVSSFRYVQADPDGFKDFCARTRSRFGDYPFTGVKPARKKAEEVET